MIFYLTFNDTPSGIYSSQVIDVVKFFRNGLATDIKLVAFISLRGFAGNRKKIKAELGDAMVLPMFPGVKRWRLNAFLLKLLCFFKKPEAIIGRSVLATQLAFKTKVKKIIYDGRGAIAAEWKEYNVITDAVMLSQIDGLEGQAVLNAHFRIAVSNQLVAHWQQKFNYSRQQHVVIPCTLNKVFEDLAITPASVLKARQDLGFKAADLVFAYAGSLAGWQSFDLLYDYIAPVLTSSPSAKLFFLAGPDKNILRLEAEFPLQVMHKKVAPAEVPAMLLAADYGLLIREQSVTNQVASPVKFAEYLACGLKVIISPGLGDYSNFVSEQDCGHVYTSYVPQAVAFEDKLRIRRVALANFTKGAFTASYRQII